MYSIIDSKNRVIGEWLGGTHYVPCYHTKKEAIADSKKLNFRTSVVKSEVAIKLSPSEHSK